MGFEKPLTGAQRTARHRAALRAQGLRPRTFWLPAASSQDFAAEAKADAEKAWALVSDEEQTMAWVDAMNEEVLRDLPD